MHFIHHCMIFTKARERIYYQHLLLLSPFLFSIKVTPRASLSRSSYCLVINSCSKSVQAPCETAANIGFTFLITLLPLNVNKVGMCAYSWSMPSQCKDII